MKAKSMVIQCQVKMSIISTLCICLWNLKATWKSVQLNLAQLELEWMCSERPSNSVEVLILQFFEAAFEIAVVLVVSVVVMDKIYAPETAGSFPGCWHGISKWLDII